MRGLERIIDDVDGLGQPFRIRTVRPGDADDDAVRFDAAELADAISGEAARMADLHADVRRMPRARHAASLVFQRYSHRVCGVAVAAWYRHGIVLDLSAGNVVLRFVDGTPDGVELREARTAGATAVDDVVRVVLDGHLIPVARALSAARGPGVPNLIGNAAAGFAGAFRALSARHPGDDVIRAAEFFLAADPRLARGGTFRTMEGPRGPRLQYDRSSCCHWYAAPDGKYCSWCSRLTQDERTTRYVEAMRAER